MKVTTKYFLEISKTECSVLVKLLGKLSDTEMLGKGLSTEEIDIIHNAWNILPAWDEEDN
jgi:hypothetical protein